MLQTERVQNQRGTVLKFGMHSEKGFTLVSEGQKKKFSSRYIQHKMITWFAKCGGFKIQGDVSTGLRKRQQT